MQFSLFDYLPEYQRERAVDRETPYGKRRNPQHAKQHSGPQQGFYDLSHLFSFETPVIAL
jgi:hypothetical protein